MQTVTLKEFFSFINFTFVTQKRKNKSLTIELLTRSATIYFSTSSKQLESETKKI